MFPYRYLTWRFCSSLLWLPPPIIFNYRLICYLRVGNILKDIKHFILIHFSSISTFYGVISAIAESLDHLFFSQIFMFSLLCFLRLCLQELLSRFKSLFSQLLKALACSWGELYLHVITPFSVWGLEISESANVFITVLGLHEDGLLVGIF